MEKILNRVRKLLAMANDERGNEGERENALRMAHALLMKHELFVEDVDKHQREKEDPRGRYDTEGWNLVWCRDLRAAVARLFLCKYLIGKKINATRGQHIWIGRASATTTAAYMSDWIIQSTLKEADRRYKHRLTPEGRSFCVGATLKLCERINDILKSSQEEVDKDAKPGNALVVVDLVRSEHDANALWAKENMNIYIIKARKQAKVDYTAYQSGRQFGGNISLSKQVATSVAPKGIK